MAFFNPPGIERLYSGVTKSTASERAIASLRAFPSGGYAESKSESDAIGSEVWSERRDA